MTAAGTLRTVAEMMRTQHGEGCPEREFYAKTADWLESIAREEEQGAVNLRERGSALQIARAYLVSQEVSADVRR